MKTGGVRGQEACPDKYMEICFPARVEKKEKKERGELISKEKPQESVERKETRSQVEETSLKNKYRRHAWRNCSS